MLRSISRNFVTKHIIFRPTQYNTDLENKKIYISTVLVLIAIVSVALSPISPAIAESSEGDSSSHSSEDKAYDEKDGKSCAEKKKERSENTDTSKKA